MNSLLFKNGTLVTPKGKQREDLLVKDGKIVEMGEGISEEGAKVVDCTGKFVLPGLIDVHVHLREPGGEEKEDFASGTAAAKAGGVTFVLDMPNNSPATISCTALNRKRELVADKAQVGFDLYMGATINDDGTTNVDEFLESEAIAYKIYVGSSTGNLLVSQKEALEEIFEKVAAEGRLICVHAEDEAIIQANMKQFKGENDPMIHGRIRSEAAAYEATKMVLHLARKYEARLHICHLSTKRELDEFAAFKSDRISCEVAPHHLFLTEMELGKQGNFAKMNPPLRKEKDNKALLEGLRNGLVNIVATDHAPHLKSEKEQDYGDAPAGVPGLETMLPLLLNAVNQGELTLEDIVRLTGEEPARLFELTGKGRLEIGADADLVVVDMDEERVVENGGPGAEFTKCGWTPFAGQKLKGWPIMTIVKGEL